MPPELGLAAMAAGYLLAAVITVAVLRRTPTNNDDPGLSLNPTNYTHNQAWLARHGITDPCPCRHPWPNHKPDPGIGCTTTGCLCLTPTTPPPRPPRAPALQPDRALLVTVWK